MDSRTITICILIGSATALVAWDIYIVTSRPREDTISEILLDWARRVSFLPYAVGVVIGHLFWPAHGMVPIDWIFSLTALLVIGFVGACVQFIARVTLNGGLAISPMIHVTLGILMGHWLWPQW